MHGNYVALPSVETLIDKLTQALKPYFPSNLPPAEQPVIIGIETGGYWIANAIHQAIAPETDLGRLNITFYRDDFTKIGRKALDPAHWYRRQNSYPGRRCIIFRSDDSCGNERNF